jgi:hypothetical protein
MRTTTELSARFIIANDDATALTSLIERFEEVEGRSDDYALEIQERVAAEDVFEDALDFERVPFASVVDDLSIELYEQDLAEGRAISCQDGSCSKCARPYYGFDEVDNMRLINGTLYCVDCIPAPRQLEIFAELDLKRKDKIVKRRREKANRFRKALEEAKRIAPNLNWERYEDDPRCFIDHYA